MSEPAARVEYRGKKTYKNFRPGPPIPYKQPVFVDHLFRLPGFAKQNCQNAFADGHVWRINFCEVISNVVLQGGNRGEGMWLPIIHSQNMDWDAPICTSPSTSQI